MADREDTIQLYKEIYVFYVVLKLSVAILVMGSAIDYLGERGLYHLNLKMLVLDFVPRNLEW